MPSWGRCCCGWASASGGSSSRRHMRDYVRGLLAPVARKNSWQLAEQAGHPTPDGLQQLFAGAKWEPDDIRDDLQEYVAEQARRGRTAS